MVGKPNFFLVFEKSEFFQGGMRVSEHLSDISGFLNHSSSLFPKLFKSKSWKEWLFCSVELGDGLIKGQT